MEMMNDRFRMTLAACAIAMLLGAPAHAADASPWVEDSYSGLRLIAGANPSGAESLRAGIEIKMQPAWHTYWRYPGDSGVPPRFSFSGSDNVAAVKVFYPAPQAFTDAARAVSTSTALSPTITVAARSAPDSAIRRSMPIG